MPRSFQEHDWLVPSQPDQEQGSTTVVRCLPRCREVYCVESSEIVACYPCTESFSIPCKKRVNVCLGGRYRWCGRDLGRGEIGEKDRGGESNEKGSIPHERDCNTLPTLCQGLISWKMAGTCQLGSMSRWHGSTCLLSRLPQPGLATFREVHGIPWQSTR